MEKTLTLAPEFVEAFDIDEVLNVFNGGQKNVFICKAKDGMVYAYKLFHGFGEREEREIGFYQKYDDHPGIPKIIKVEEFKGSMVLVEEYIEGKSLSEVLQDGSFAGDTDKVLELISQVIDILKKPWEDGLVHRDLKPDNIIIKPDGSPVIVDFGIARDLNAETITETGFQPNSWKFAAPEQHFAKKDQISYRTDFFSVGVMAYFMYYGRLPFGETSEDVKLCLSKADFVPEFTDDNNVKKFCIHACKINPSERPRNVDLLSANLR
jgi:serine/threonine protein kinase